MTTLKKDVIEDTLGEVKVQYLDRTIANWWNNKKSSEDLRLFCGWYWLRGSEERGPFRTRSAALRDAYYRFVLHEEVPLVWKDKRPGAQTRKVAGKRVRLEPRVAS